MANYEKDLIRLSCKAVEDGNERLYWRYTSMLEIYRKNKNAQS